MSEYRAKDYLVGLFDEMARTYGFVHLVASLGFAYFWRRACVRRLDGIEGRVCDLMAGGGECVRHLKRRLGRSVSVDLFDFSSVMCERARATIRRAGYEDCRAIHADVLEMEDGAGTYDAVVSTFGVKTLGEDDLRRLAATVHRLLKPGGRYSLLELSVPGNPLVRAPFRFYVAHVVPWIGRLALGNPENYAMLWKYTAAFGDCTKLAAAFREAGLTVVYERHVFGCATQVSGEKPAA